MSNPTSRRFFLGAATRRGRTRSGAPTIRSMSRSSGSADAAPIIWISTRSSRKRASSGICDIDQAAREKAQATLFRNTGEKAKEFEDMRAAFADPGVEAVSIATPNHWHALAAIWAMKAGKDVYGEKPACYDIYEGQRMIEVSRETKKMLQIGSQHRSMPFKSEAMQALQEGLIGKVYLAKGLCYKRRASIGHKPDSPTPPGVNWDLFLGPAPLRPVQRTAL